MAVLMREQRLMERREKKRAYDRQFHNPYQLSGAAKRKKYGTRARVAGLHGERSSYLVERTTQDSGIICVWRGKHRRGNISLHSSRCPWSRLVHAIV